MVVGLDDLAEAHEGVLRDHRVVAGPEQRARDELDDLDRAVPGQDLLDRHAEVARERLPQLGRLGVRVAVDLPERPRARPRRPSARAERVLVRSQLDDVAQAQLALHLADRLARLEALEPCEVRREHEAGGAGGAHRRPPRRGPDPRRSSGPRCRAARLRSCPAARRGVARAERRVAPRRSAPSLPRGRIPPGVSRLGVALPAPARRAGRLLAAAAAGPSPRQAAERAAARILAAPQALDLLGRERAELAGLEPARRHRPDRDPAQLRDRVSDRLEQALDLVLLALVQRQLHPGVVVGVDHARAVDRHEVGRRRARRGAAARASARPGRRAPWRGRRAAPRSAGATTRSAKAPSFVSRIRPSVVTSSRPIGKQPRHAPGPGSITVGRRSGSLRVLTTPRGLLSTR